MISVYKGIVQDSYKVNLSEMGLSFLEFNVQSLESNVETDSANALDGDFITYNQFLNRNIEAKMFIRANDSNDFQNKKSDVYKLFNSRQKLLIVDERLRVRKIWEVYTNGGYSVEPNQTARTGEFELTLTSESPYAIAEHNVIVTKDTHKDNYYFFSPSQVMTISEVAEDNTFTIQNTGDISIDARQHKLNIKFKGASDKLRIVNQNNNTQWQYKGTTEAKDLIELDSIYPYKNKKNIFDDTNFGVITLDKGANLFKVFGSEKFEIKVEYKAMYI